MTDLTKLLSLDPTSIEWEAERCRLIKAEIDSAPEHLRKKLQLLQMELDQVRDRSTPEEFMQYLLHVAQENRENQEDYELFIKHQTQ